MIILNGFEKSDSGIALSIVTQYGANGAVLLLTLDKRHERALIDILSSFNKVIMYGRGKERRVLSYDQLRRIIALFAVDAGEPITKAFSEWTISELAKHDKEIRAQASREAHEMYKKKLERQEEEIYRLKHCDNVPRERYTLFKRLYHEMKAKYEALASLFNALYYEATQGGEYELYIGKKKVQPVVLGKMTNKKKKG